MQGSPIPGPHWLTIDLGADAGAVTKLMLDFETAFAKDYTIKTQQTADSPWRVLVPTAVEKSTFVGAGSQTHIVHELTFDGADGEGGCSRMVQLHINKPATNWGTSVWEMQVWGVQGAGGCSS
jgi:hypothetical protein